MSLLGSIGNAIVGGGEQALGAVSSLGGLAPSTFSTAATNAGHNITNPGTNVLGNINPGYSFSGPTGIAPTTTINSAFSGNAPVQGAPVDTGTTTTSGATSGSTSQGLVDTYKNVYDTYLNNAQNRIDQNPQSQQVAEAGQSGLYAGQQGLINQQHVAGTDSNALAQQNLDNQKTRSLRDLNQSLQGQVQGYNNQLGTYGAGDSSASQVLNYALGRQNDQQRNDLLQQSGSQQSGIDLQKKNLDDAYGAKTNNLELSKQNSIGLIRQQYGDAMAKLQESLTQYRGDEAINLARYGQNAAADQALQQFQALQSQYDTHKSAMDLAYQNYTGPQSDISKFSQAPTVQSLTTQQPGQFDLSGATSQNYAPQYVPVNLKRTTDPTSQI